MALEVPREEVQSYGMVVADSDGRIQSFQEKPKPEDALSTLASTGIYIFEPAVLDKVPAGQVYDIGSQLFPQLAQDKLPFFVQNRPFNWLDIGRVSDYWAVLQRVLKGEIDYMKMPGKEVQPGIWVGLNTWCLGTRSRLKGLSTSAPASRLSRARPSLGLPGLGMAVSFVRCAGLRGGLLFEYTRIPADMHFFEMIVSRHYCVNRHGETLYRGDDTSRLRWGDARA